MNCEPHKTKLKGKINFSFYQFVYAAWLWLHSFRIKKHESFDF